MAYHACFLSNGRPKYHVCRENMVVNKLSGSGIKYQSNTLEMVDFDSRQGRHRFCRRRRSL